MDDGEGKERLRSEARNPRDGVSESPRPVDKKTYDAPQLTIYGSIDKLTRTGGRTTRDGGRGRRRH